MLTATTLCALLLGGSSAAGGAAPPTLNAGHTIYRLGGNASFQEGCFPPCQCPLSEPAPVRGTFLLGRPIPGNVFDFHEVRDINWTVTLEGLELHEITGSGWYQVTNYGPPQLHALDLQLSIDGGPSQHFFSDLLSVTGNDGMIDIPISVHGMFCDDIVIRVAASPVGANAILRSRLVDGSTYQEGCFDPCDCLLE